MKKSKLILIEFFITLSSLVYIYTKTDLKNIEHYNLAFNLANYIPALLLLFLSIFLITLRQFHISSFLKIHLTKKSLFEITATSQLYGQILPANVGSELYKLGKLSKYATKKDILLLIVIDRFLGIFSLGVLYALFFPSGMANLKDGLVLHVGFLLFCGLLFFLIMVVFIWLARTKISAIKTQVNKSGLVSVSNQKLINLVTLGAVNHFVVILSTFFLAKSFGFDLSLSSLINSYTFATFALVLPITIGGWGVREGIYSAVSTAFGENALSAIIVSVSFGLSLILVGLLSYFVRVLCGAHNSKSGI